MIDEVRYILDNAKKVGQGNKPQIPMLLFISNGKGTGWDKKNDDLSVRMWNFINTLDDRE